MESRRRQHRGGSGPHVDVVALAASAGGINALGAVLAALPSDFRAGVLIVQHVSPQHRSMMAEILGRTTTLEVSEAVAGARVAPGMVFVAPPDHHLLVRSDGTLELTQSELVHFVRPSADLLFESVAAAYGHRAAVVVLTGTGSDGSLGAKAAKEKDATVIAQNEGTCEHFGMPAAAIATGAVDVVLPLEHIAPTLVKLVETGNLDAET